MPEDGTDFRLPPQSHIAYVRLRVASLTRALDFYAHLLGFQLLAKNAAAAALSATGEPPARIILHESPQAQPKPPHTTGLYHIAIRFPDRRGQARALQRLLDQQWPVHGFADHGVSEAIYLADPDGNGVELYSDRPRNAWPRQGGMLQMMTRSLDIDDLLAQGRGAPATPAIAPGTDIGHVHLHVADLRRAEAFYREKVGFEVTQRTFPGALFFAAGGYHHHLGLNIWAGEGAPPPPPEAAGLLAFGIAIPEAGFLSALRERLQAAGHAPREIAARPQAVVEKTVPAEGGFLVQDPDGMLVEFIRAG